MARNLHPCPVKGCPGLREAGAFFCRSHTLKTRPEWRRDIAWMVRNGAFDSARRAIKGVAAILKSSDTPAPLTGGIRRTETSKSA